MINPYEVELQKALDLESAIIGSIGSIYEAIQASKASLTNWPTQAVQNYYASLLASLNDFRAGVEDDLSEGLIVHYRHKANDWSPEQEACDEYTQQKIDAHRSYDESYLSTVNTLAKGAL